MFIKPENCRSYLVHQHHVCGFVGCISIYVRDFVHWRGYILAGLSALVSCISFDIQAIKTIEIIY